MSSSVSPRLAREDYDAFKILLRDDPEFPHTFDDWQTSTLRADVKRVNSGHSVHAVPIAPKEFEQYCHSCGREPTAAMLIAYAVIKAARG